MEPVVAEKDSSMQIHEMSLNVFEKIERFKNLSINHEVPVKCIKRLPPLPPQQKNIL